MKTIIVAFAALLVISTVCAKGGGRGGGGRGGGSRGGSRGSSSSSGGSWFSWGRSKPAASPSYSSPSYSSPSYKSPSPPSYGWNTGGAPPAYPGLQNRPVHNSHSPPAYSPSYSNPPGYSRYGNNYNSYTRTNNYQPPNYGTQFGRSGVGSNTYIHNNYYGGGSYGSGSGSNFLTNALFYSAGRHHGYSMGHPVYYGSGSRSWSERQDREWRETTQAPYFENKVPGGESVLPAAAVIGAATAFGLTTLLPLNVPKGKPLMYCNSSFIEQNPIKVNNSTYSCMNGSIAMSCPRTFENGTSFDKCLSTSQTLRCNLVKPSGTIYCTNATLLSRLSIFCETTTQFNKTVVVNGTSFNETETVLNCKFGELPQGRSSFIPTTTTEAPSTTEKSLSLEAQMHVFFLRLIGNSHVLETTTPAPTTTTEAPLQLWIPEAMTISPEPTIERTTTEPYVWAFKYATTYINGTSGYGYKRIADDFINFLKEVGNRTGMSEKVPLCYCNTTENLLENSTVTTENISESSSDLTDMITST